MFNDGQKWLARIRTRRIIAPDLNTLKMNINSEVATVTALYRAGVAVPQAWESNRGSEGVLTLLCVTRRLMYSSDTSNLIYCFQEFVDGEPDDAMGRAGQEVVVGDELQRIRNIAKWFLSVEKVTFTHVGSPKMDMNGAVSIGPIIDPSFAGASPPYFLGPFPTAKSRYIETIDALLQQTLAGRRYPPSEVLSAYLVLLETRSLVEGCTEMDEGPNYIKHGEDKGDHFLFNNNDLVAAIDWESLVYLAQKRVLIDSRAYTTCKAEAFAAPIGLIDNSLPGDSNILSYQEEALASVYESELGRPNLALIVRKGKKYQHLSSIILFGMWLLPQSLNALRRAFLDLPDGIEEPQTEEEWVANCIGRYRFDSGLQTLLRV